MPDTVLPGHLSAVLAGGGGCLPFTGAQPAVPHHLRTPISLLAPVAASFLSVLQLVTFILPARAHGHGTVCCHVFRRRSGNEEVVQPQVSQSYVMALRMSPGIRVEQMSPAPPQSETYPLGWNRVGHYLLIPCDPMSRFCLGALNRALTSGTSPPMNLPERISSNLSFSPS